MSHASLYFRQPVDRLGIAPFSGMYLYGENAKDHFGDNVHPEIHDSDGVLMNTGSGDWIWHPLQQTTFLQLYSFLDENPKGFGLIQRDRDFQHYQDLNNKYNVRPSAWVTPHGNWDKGKIELIQPNSKDVNTDNVVIFWWPDQPVKAGDHLDLNYTIDFYMNDASRPPLAYCKQTLVNSPAPPSVAPPQPNAPPTPPAPAAKPAAKPGPAPPVASTTPPGVTPVQFLVDFAGNGIENIRPISLPITISEASSPAPSSAIRRSRKMATIIHGGSPSPSCRPRRMSPTDIHCRLIHNNKPITETWSYTWHQ